MPKTKFLWWYGPYKPVYHAFRIYNWQFYLTSEVLFYRNIPFLNFSPSQPYHNIFELQAHTPDSARTTCLIEETFKGFAGFVEFLGRSGSSWRRWSLVQWLWYVRTLWRSFSILAQTNMSSQIHRCLCRRRSNWQCQSKFGKSSY